MKVSHWMSLGFAIAGSLCLGSVQASDVGSSPHSGFGAGLVFGDPTGVSMKYWLSEKSAIDGVVGWSFADETNFHLHTDYLYHLFDLIPVDTGSLPLYFGGGVRYKVRNRGDDLFGIRAVVGVSYLFQDLPIDIFGEIGPILDVVPSVRARLSIGIGARFWF